MYNFIKSLILKMFKVPPKPALPIHTKGAEIKVFRASYNYYRYKFYLWLIGTVFSLGAELGVTIGIMLEMIYTKSSLAVLISVSVISLVLFAGLAIQRLFAYIMIKLDYEMRWYMISDKSIRIREGITRVKEMTMSIVNIQNIYETQGPIQRLFKICDIKVETAGGGGYIAAANEQSNMQGSAVMHAAYFRGVDNSAEILNILKMRLKGVKTSGLGDNEELQLDGVFSDIRQQSESDRTPKSYSIDATNAASFISALKTLKQEIIMLKQSIRMT